MTDENITSENADSGRTTNEKLAAELIATSGPSNDPDVYLVEYSDGTHAYEPATPTNTVLFEDGLFEEVNGTHSFHHNNKQITVVADVFSRNYTISVSGNEVAVPDDYADDLVDAFTSHNTAEIVHDLYYDIIEGQVRRDVVDSFLDRFPEDRVEIEASGWVIDDTFVVTYEAENYLLNQDTVYVRKSDDMVEADESKQAVDLEFNIDDEATLATATGETVTATAREQEFVATVECLLYPADYLGAELVDEIEQHKAEAFADGIEDIASTATVTAHTDTKTGNHHGHGFDKHRAINEAAAGDLDSTLGMTEEAVDMLYFNDYDHAAPHELIARRQEFENAPFDIFADDDVANDDNRRWTAISKAKSSAPINDEHQRQIEQMFGDGNTEVQDQHRLSSF